MVTIYKDAAGHVSTVIKGSAGEILAPTVDAIGQKIISNLDGSGGEMWTYSVDSSGNILSSSHRPFGRWLEAVANRSVAGVQLLKGGVEDDLERTGTQISYAAYGLGKIAVAIGSKVSEVTIKAGEQAWDAVQREYYHASDLGTNEWRQFQGVVVRLSEVRSQIRGLDQTLTGLKGQLASLPQIHSPDYLASYSSRLRVLTSPSIKLAEVGNAISVTGIKAPSGKDLTAILDGQAAIFGAKIVHLTDVLPKVEKIATEFGGSIGTFITEIVKNCKKFGNDFAIAWQRDVAVTVAWWHKIQLPPRSHSDSDDLTDQWIRANVLPTLQKGELCLKRTQVRTDNYLSALKSLNIAAWSQDSSKITNADIDTVSNALDEQMKALAAGLTELTLNKCEGLNLDNVIEDALRDAQEWRDFVHKLKSPSPT